MLHLRWALLVAVTFTSSLLAQDDPPPDEPPPPRPPAQVLFEATVTVAEQAVTVAGTSTSLPDGTRLSVSVTIDGAPTEWKRVYVMKGAFSIAIPRDGLRPASYELLVRYEARGQIRELNKALAKLPIQSERRYPFAIGSPLEAARNSLAEGKMLAAALTPVIALLDKLDVVAQAQGETLSQGKYDVARSRAVYDEWLRERAQVYAPVEMYLKAHAIHYKPAQLVDLENIFRKVERYGRDTHYDECMKAKIDPRSIPAIWSPKSGLVTPKMIRAFVEAEVSKLVAAVEARVAADAEAVAALERAASGSGSGSN